jgi:N6-L-threonylcarbamoyladenine synthase
LAEQRCADNGIELRVPPLSLCTDNGAMIAALGAHIMSRGFAPSELDFPVDSTLPVSHVHV